jgi:hypothetical protein
MKWIVLAVFAFVLFWIFRRLNREQNSVSFPSDPNQSFPPMATPMPTQAPTESEYALRTPMSFDDFYNHYYASENIDREFVQRILAYVSHAGGVPAELLRPEDRLNALPKRSAYVGMKMVEKMVGGALKLGAVEQTGSIPELHLDTVDSLIRQLEPHHVELLKAQAFHHGTDPHS